MQQDELDYLPNAMLFLVPTALPYEYIGDGSLLTWVKLCYQLVQRRVKPAVVLAYIQSIQSSSWAVRPRQVVHALLANSYHGCNIADPMMWEYLKILLDHELIRIDDLIMGVFDRSVHRLRVKSDGSGEIDSALLAKLRQSCFFIPTELECDILESTAGIIASQQQWYPGSNELLTIFAIFIRWLPELCLSDSYPDVKLLLLPEFDLSYCRSHEFYDSVGTFLIAFLQNSVVNASFCDIPKASVISFGRSLEQFTSLWASFSPGLATKLDSIWRTTSLLDRPGAEDHDNVMASFQSAPYSQIVNLPDFQYEYSRSGLMIFLSSLIVSYPLTDEALITNYLVSRYKADAQVMATQLIIATFDLLANGMYRNESADVMFAMRSLAINKVPIILGIISPNIPLPLTVESCITDALNQIDPHMFPSFSESFMMGQGKTLSDVRQDFIFSCQLHGFLSSDFNAGGFGDRLLDSSPIIDKKLDKQDAVRKYTNNLNNISVLIDGLESLDGNACAIVAALVEIVQGLSNDRDMTGLKVIANIVSRKTFFLDVILQFSPPTAFLRPFCDVIDAYKYDDDQSEYQPVYEEFSAIMLMLQAFFARFKLKASDLCISDQSFIGKYIAKDFTAKPLESLTAGSKKRLSLWTRGLFDLDGNIDEAMAECQPQQFYLLVPELFREVLEGVTSGSMTLEAVKNGFDFLFESFLVPSLVDGIEWMCRHGAIEVPAKKSTKSEALQLIQRLMMKPTSRSGDAPAMHRVVLSVTGLTLHIWLTGKLGKETPSDPAIRRMLETLQSVPSYDAGINSAAEMSRWVGCPGGIAAALGDMFDSLVRWHMSPSRGPTGVVVRSSSGQQSASKTQASFSVKYTHRLFLAAVHDLLGPNQVADLLIEKIVHHFTCSLNQGQLAIDVAVSLASAPSVAENSNVNNPFKPTWPACPSTMAAMLSPYSSPSPSDSFPLGSSPLTNKHHSFPTLPQEEQYSANMGVMDFIRLKAQRLGTGMDVPDTLYDPTSTNAALEATHRLYRELEMLASRAAERFGTSVSQVITYLSPQSAPLPDLMALNLATATRHNAPVGVGDSTIAAVVAAAAAANSVASGAAMAHNSLGLDPSSWIDPMFMMDTTAITGEIPESVMTGISASIGTTVLSSTTGKPVDVNGISEVDLFSFDLVTAPSGNVSVGDHSMAAMKSDSKDILDFGEFLTGAPSTVGGVDLGESQPGNESTVATTALGSQEAGAITTTAGTEADGSADVSMVDFSAMDMNFLDLDSFDFADQPEPELK